MPLSIRCPDRVAPLALALTLGLATAASAQDAAGSLAMRADDRLRLEALDEAAGSALRGAFGAGTPDEIAALTSALSGQALPPGEGLALAEGEWTCRMIKMGRLLPIVVYQPFRCRLDAEGRFEKTTGSQLTRGRIRAEGDRLIYLGTGYIAGDTAPDYDALPEAVDPGAQPQVMPEIGLVEITGPDRGRIIFPRPYLESELNLLDLRR